MGASAVCGNGDNAPCPTVRVLPYDGLSLGWVWPLPCLPRADLMPVQAISCAIAGANVYVHKHVFLAVQEPKSI